MNIGKVSTDLNAAIALNFKVAFEDIPQYGVRNQFTDDRGQKSGDRKQ